jgi:hypothetical protein
VAVDIVGSVIVVGELAFIFGEIVPECRRRRRAARRAIEAEWRIHQIKGDARARMWDEVTRHRTGDG